MEGSEREGSVEEMCDREWAIFESKELCELEMAVRLEIVSERE